MSNDVELQDILDDGEADLDAPMGEDPAPRGRMACARVDRDCRRAIEQLREDRRLRELLEEDYDLDD